MCNIGCQKQAGSVLDLTSPIKSLDCVASRVVCKRNTIVRVLMDAVQQH